MTFCGWRIRTQNRDGSWEGSGRQSDGETVQLRARPMICSRSPTKATKPITQNRYYYALINAMYVFCQNALNSGSIIAMGNQRSVLCVTSW
jgi:hypothetical protein